MSNPEVNFFRVMATQETGEEICVANRVSGSVTAYKLAVQAMDDHPEWRDAWIEREEAYRFF